MKTPTDSHYGQIQVFNVLHNENPVISWLLYIILNRKNVKFKEQKQGYKRNGEIWKK